MYNINIGTVNTQKSILLPRTYLKRSAVVRASLNDIQITSGANLAYNA